MYIFGKCILKLEQGSVYIKINIKDSINMIRKSISDVNTVLTGFKSGELNEILNPFKMEVEQNFTANTLETESKVSSSLSLSELLENNDQGNFWDDIEDRIFGFLDK